MAPPVGLDTASLLQLSRDRLDQVVDEIELMQTDPEYMRDYVLRLKASIRWDESVSPALKWGYIAERILNTWTNSLGIWRLMVNECQELQDACRKHHQGVTTIMPGTRLSSEVTVRYRALIEMLRRYLEIQMDSLYSATQDMSAMKSMHQKGVNKGQLYDKIRMRNLNDSKEQSNRIAVAFGMLSINFPFGPHFHLRKMAIDRFAEELSAAEFDKHVDDQLSDLARLDALRLSVIYSQVVIDREPAFPKNSRIAFS